MAPRRRTHKRCILNVAFKPSRLQSGGRRWRRGGDPNTATRKSGDGAKPAERGGNRPARRCLLCQGAAGRAAGTGLRRRDRRGGVAGTSREDVRLLVVGDVDEW